MVFSAKKARWQLTLFKLQNYFSSEFISLYPWQEPIAVGLILIDLYFKWKVKVYCLAAVHSILFHSKLLLSSSFDTSPHLTLTDNNSLSSKASLQLQWVSLYVMW